MKNPLKRLQTLFKPHPRRTGLDDPELEKKIDYAECHNIWPNGTWRSAIRPTRLWKDLDITVRGELLRVWAFEQFRNAERAAGHSLNPGQFSVQYVRIEPGWKPHEKDLKEIWIRDNKCAKSLHYVVGELQSRGRLVMGRA